jgi:hypothetical protein
MIIAGLAAVVLSQLDWVPGQLVLFGASDGLSGPFGMDLDWLERLPNIVGALGAAAALTGALALRWPLREVAAIVALALVLGTAFQIAWLVDPPSAVLEVEDAEPFSFRWPAYAAAVALADAAVSAVWLTRRA